MGFRHSNYPSWVQFVSVTFSEVLTKKLLIHLGCYSGGKNKFLKAVRKKQTLIRQHKFLGADCVSLKLKRGLVQQQFVKAKV